MKVSRIGEISLRTEGYDTERGASDERSLFLSRCLEGVDRRVWQLVCGATNESQ